MRLKLDPTNQKNTKDKQQLIKSKEVEILYDQARVSILAAQSAALIFIFAMWGHTSTSILLAWIITLSLLNVARYFLLVTYFKAEDRKDNYKTWLNRFLIGTTISGAFWGGLALLVLPAENPYYTAWTILVISGLVGAAVGTYAISRPAFITYASTSLLPLCFVLLIQGENILQIFGLLVCVYYLLLSASMFRLNIMAKQSVNLQFENVDLLYQLENEKQTIAAMNQELELDIEQRKETEIELLEAKGKAEGLADTLSMLSQQDALTGIANRRGFDEFLANAWNRATRNHSPISLILCDVDFFKDFNDHYGHPAGDDVLRKIAISIEKRVRRGSDLVARYGGEEFAIILPDAKISQTHIVAEQIRMAIQRMCIPHEKSSVSEHVSISLGIATVIPNMDMHSPTLIEQADEALYSAKAAGRNQTSPLFSQDKVNILKEIK
jgi:diguanylate cyclase (GGDEF)-like protein